MSRAASGALAPSDDLAARVIILANRDDPASGRVARHYAAARHVPVANIVELAMPSSETISWREFVTAIWEPLTTALVERKWIDAIPMNLTDSVGRRKYVANSHRIAALVVCRGVPLRIAHDPLLSADVPPFTVRAEFRTNAGAVDAELSLLATSGYPINAFVPNPLFNNDRPFEFSARQVIKVSRLDGPTVEDAEALVDHALAAERDGLLGRGYVDLGDFDRTGNAWFESAAAQIAALGFDLDVDSAPATLPATARIDAPALYFGWYAGELNGPFALPGFRFPPGAIALHLHSYSATTLRSATSGWVGPLVARGVTATFGNVYEPYLQFTHRPDLMLRALARGATLVDATYFGLQALSWQQVLIGDPLYRPFAVPLTQQLQRLDEVEPSLAPYVLLRRARLLDAAHDAQAATELLWREHRRRPSLPLAIALAQRYGGNRSTALEALKAVLPLNACSSNEWAAAREAARLATEYGATTEAFAIWRTLFEGSRLAPELRHAWAEAAIAAARAAGHPAEASAWQSLTR